MSKSQDQALATAIATAQKEADHTGMMRIVYQFGENYGTAATLPIHGNRIGNCYPVGYTVDRGYYPNADKPRLQSGWTSTHKSKPSPGNHGTWPDGESW